MLSSHSPAEPANTGISVIEYDLALPFSPSKPFCLVTRALLQGQALFLHQPFFREREGEGQGALGAVRCLSSQQLCQDRNTNDGLAINRSYVIYPFLGWQ